MDEFDRMLREIINSQQQQISALRYDVRTLALVVSRHESVSETCVYLKHLGRKALVD